MGQIATDLTRGRRRPFGRRGDQGRQGPRAWTPASATLAPVALIGGWVVAGARQPAGYDPVHDTISALAAVGATDRAVMTTGLAALGVAHLTTALGLRGVRAISRLVLGAAGVATIGVAVFAQPEHGSSAAHVACATSAFVLLAVWPATTAQRGSAPVVRRTVAIAGSILSLGLLAWFAATLSDGPVGLSERVLSAQQALWPLAVVLGLRASHRRGAPSAR